MTAVLNHILYTDTPSGYQHIEIEHDGTATWLDLQIVKNEVWGEDAIAFEVYPPKAKVVNGESTEFHYRHLWLMPRCIKWPDISPD